MGFEGVSNSRPGLIIGGTCNFHGENMPMRFTRTVQQADMPAGRKIQPWAIFLDQGIGTA
jgi:hypothetical protein